MMHDDAELGKCDTIYGDATDLKRISLQLFHFNYLKLKAATTNPVFSNVEKVLLSKYTQCVF